MLVAGVLASLPTQANLITGSIWENSGGANGSLSVAQGLLGNRSADVTFLVNSPIDFDNRTRGDGYTIGGFLASGGAVITGGADGGAAGHTVDNTIFYFTGQVTVQHGQTFNVTHDDGLQLMIGSTLVVDVPGPTGPSVTTYTWTGASGTYNFELAYAEVSGPPAVLAVDLPLESAVPEPSTYIAGAMLLLPFGSQGVRKLRDRLRRA